MAFRIVTFSSFAFGTLDVDLDYLIKINNKSLLPDLTIFLDIRPEICLKRSEKRGKNQTLFEERKKLKKVRWNFKRMKNLFPNIIEVNGEGKIEEVFKKITESVEKFIETD